MEPRATSLHWEIRWPHHWLRDSRVTPLYWANPWPHHFVERIQGHITSLRESRATSLHWENPGPHHFIERIQGHITSLRESRATSLHWEQSHTNRYWHNILQYTGVYLCMFYHYLPRTRDMGTLLSYILSRTTYPGAPGYGGVRTWVERFQACENCAFIDLYATVRNSLAIISHFAI